MKRRLSNLLGLQKSTDRQDSKPEVTSSAENKELEAEDDEAVDENNGLLLLKFRRDVKEGKIGGLQSNKPWFMTSLRDDNDEAKDGRDPRLTKPLEDGVAFRMREELFSSMEAENLERLNKIIREINNHGVVLHHIKLLNDSGMTVLHEALEKRHMKSAKWLIENTESEFCAIGLVSFNCRAILNRINTSCIYIQYVNINRQIPPSYKTSLHILCEIGDVHLVEILLRKLRTLDNQANNDDENKAKSVGFKAAITGQAEDPEPEQKSTKPQSGIYDWMVLQVNKEPRRRVQCIHLAAMNDHHELIRLLVKHEFNINTSDGEGQTPLAWAAKCGNVNSVKTLLELKADVNMANAYDCTPLHWACEREHKEVVKALLRGAPDQIQVNRTRVRAPRTAIVIAATLNNAPIVKQLLKTGKVDRLKKLEALLVASVKGHKDVVAAVLDNAPDLLDENDEDGDTALLVAAEKGRLEVVQWLVEMGADLTKKNCERKTLFDLAMHQKDNAILDYLMKTPRTGSSTEDFHKESYYIHMAAQEGDVEKIIFLAQAGIDYRMALDKEGNTFVHAAVSHNQVNILEEFLSRYDDIINQQNNDGDTPLHIAARKGFLDSVEKLISLKARLNIANKDGRTALHAAVMCPLESATGIVEVIRDAILASGSRILDEVDRLGFTALHLACKHKRADLIPELKQLDPECTSRDDQTALHVAVQFGTVDCIRALLDTFRKSGRRIKIDGKDKDGASALHLCVDLGLERKFELLMNRGADMSLLDNNGMSILHRMVEVSIKTPNLADDMIRLYIIIVEGAAHWWVRKKGIICPPEESRDFHFMRLEGVRYLTCQIFYEGMNVLQYASKLGALMLMKEILSTPNVYKITRTSPLRNKSTGINDVNSDLIGLILPIHRKNDVSGDHSNLILSTMFMEKVVLFDVTYLVPGHIPMKIQNLKRAESIKEKKSDKNQEVEEEHESSMEKEVIIKDGKKETKCKPVSCIQLIVNHKDVELAVDLLDSDPFKMLVKNYWAVCRRGFEALMWTHVIYMILFTYFMIPSSTYLRNRFHINDTHPEEVGRQYESSAAFHGLFLVWPCLIILYEIISGIYHISRLRDDYTLKEVLHMDKMKLLKEVFHMDTMKLSEVTSGLMRVPIAVLLFIFGNLSHISSLAFSTAIVVWYAIYINTTNAHRYLESLAMVFVFGWLHTINYVKGFKDWNAFASILKKIILKDLVRFTYIFIFILISFGYAIHVLMIADYMTTDEHQSATSTIYLCFYRMLSPGNVLDVSEDENYKASGGSVPILRMVWAAYSCLTTVILMNLLIAMMNSTYSDVQSTHATAWRVESLKMALWVERQLPIRIVRYNTIYDKKQDRYYLKYKPAGYKEVDQDEDDEEDAAADTKSLSKVEDNVSLHDHHLDEPDKANVKDNDNLERGLLQLTSEVTQLRDELDSSRKAEEKTQQLLEELQKQMQVIAQTLEQGQSRLTTRTTARTDI